MIEIHHLTSSQTMTVDTKPVVRHPSFIQFVQDGQIVGEVDATFDFTQLPKNYHLLALQFLRGHRCVLPPSNWESIRKGFEEEKRPWWKFW